MLSQHRSPRARLFLAATILAKRAWGSRRADPSARICVKVRATISRAVGLPRRRACEKVMISPAVFDRIVPLLSIRGFAACSGWGLVELWALADFKCPSRSSRSSMSRTPSLVQNLHPSAVGTPRSVNAAAIACGFVMPSACISAMMGASANARAFARAVCVLRPASPASGGKPFGLDFPACSFWQSGWHLHRWWILRLLASCASEYVSSALHLADLAASPERRSDRSRDTEAPNSHSRNSQALEPEGISDTSQPEKRTSEAPRLRRGASHRTSLEAIEVNRKAPCNRPRAP